MHFVAYDTAELIQIGWYVYKYLTDVLFVICAVHRVKQRQLVWTSSSYFWMRSREIHDWMKYCIHCMMRKGLQKSSVLTNRMSKLAVNVSNSKWHSVLRWMKILHIFLFSVKIFEYLNLLLIDYIEQSLSWKAVSCLAIQDGFSQEPTAWYYSERVQYDPHTLTLLFVKTSFNIIIPSTCRPNMSLPSKFPDQNFVWFSYLNMCATYLFHSFFFFFSLSVIIIGEDYKLWSSWFL